MRLRFVILFIYIFLFCGCATWYQRNIAFHQAIENGNFNQAEKILCRDKKAPNGKNQILFYLNLGYVHFIQGHFEESNACFETAEELTEQQRRNVLSEATILISNPEARPYRPEDFEVIMINIYKALNYLQLENTEDALVEARKINIRLQQLNDKYSGRKNRYQQDAFAHLVMGLIYDAAGDANNAFIAYRNAYEVYQNSYTDNFGLSSPSQLQQDLLRTAYQAGLQEELKEFEQKFQRTYTPGTASTNGDLVFFWLNGSGPIKEEWGLSFTKIDKGNGIVSFHNQELGLSFPFFWRDYDYYNQNSLADVNIIRVAFPKYQERPLTFYKGNIEYNHHTYSLQQAEDINEIAFKTLNDRMLRELSSSLLRVAVKQSIKHVASKQNEWLGFAVGIANALTEKTDTRNWQTLPYNISYTRIPLTSEENHMSIHLTGPNGTEDSQEITIPASKKGTRFFVYRTL